MGREFKGRFRALRKRDDPSMRLAGVTLRDLLLAVCRAMLVGALERLKRKLNTDAAREAAVTKLND